MSEKYMSEKYMSEKYMSGEYMSGEYMSGEYMSGRYQPLIMMADGAEGGEYDTDVVVLDPILEPKKPPMTAIIMHNDDYTTMEFVVWVLMSVLHLDETSAVARTMEVHHIGQACVAVLPHEIAQSKANKMRLLAEKEEFPLMITLESK